jgi:6-phosphogluconolactonase
MTDSQSRNPQDPPALRYSDLETLSNALADKTIATLKSALGERGAASLIVSGGKTPTKLFQLLRTKDLDWSRVSVALVDERWVDTSSADSNEHLVRSELLRDKAAAARFIGLKNAAPTPDSGAVSAWESFARVPRPFDLVVLGMGDDGHTASLFPNSPNLATALDTATAPGCVGMWAPVAPQPRMSLNLSALLDTRQIVILLNGTAKWRTYVSASAPGAVSEMPIRAVLRQTRTPVEVMWAP